MSISKGIVVCRSHIVNISNDGVYTMSDGCGVDFIFRYCNAEMATVEGVPVEEMLNRSFYKVLSYLLITSLLLFKSKSFLNLFI